MNDRDLPDVIESSSTSSLPHPPVESIQKSVTFAGIPSADDAPGPPQTRDMGVSGARRARSLAVVGTGSIPSNSNSSISSSTHPLEPTPPFVAGASISLSPRSSLTSGLAAGSTEASDSNTTRPRPPPIITSHKAQHTPHVTKSLTSPSILESKVPLDFLPSSSSDAKLASPSTLSPSVPVLAASDQQLSARISVSEAPKQIPDSVSAGSLAPASGTFSALSVPTSPVTSVSNPTLGTPGPSPIDKPLSASHEPLPSPTQFTRSFSMAAPSTKPKEPQAPPESEPDKASTPIPKTPRMTGSRKPSLIGIVDMISSRSPSVTGHSPSRNSSVSRSTTEPPAHYGVSDGFMAIVKASKIMNTPTTPDTAVVKAQFYDQVLVASENMDELQAWAHVTSNFDMSTLQKKDERPPDLAFVDFRTRSREASASAHQSGTSSFSETMRSSRYGDRSLVTSAIAEHDGEPHSPNASPHHPRPSTASRQGSTSPITQKRGLSQRPSFSSVLVDGILKDSSVSEPVGDTAGRNPESRLQVGEPESLVQDRLSTTMGPGRLRAFFQNVIRPSVEINARRPNSKVFRGDKESGKLLSLRMAHQKLSQVLDDIDTYIEKNNNEKQKQLMELHQRNVETVRNVTRAAVVAEYEKSNAVAEHKILLQDIAKRHLQVKALHKKVAELSDVLAQRDDKINWLEGCSRSARLTKRSTNLATDSEGISGFSLLSPSDRAELEPSDHEDSESLHAGAAAELSPNEPHIEGESQPPYIEDTSGQECEVLQTLSGAQAVDPEAILASGRFSALSNGTWEEWCKNTDFTKPKWNASTTVPKSLVFAPTILVSDPPTAEESQGPFSVALLSSLAAIAFNPALRSPSPEHIIARSHATKVPSCTQSVVRTFTGSAACFCRRKKWNNGEQLHQRDDACLTAIFSSESIPARKNAVLNTLYDCLSDIQAQKCEMPLDDELVGPEDRDEWLKRISARENLINNIIAFASGVTGDGEGPITMPSVGSPQMPRSQRSLDSSKDGNTESIAGEALSPTTETPRRVSDYGVHHPRPSTSLGLSSKFGSHDSGLHSARWTPRPSENQLSLPHRTDSNMHRGEKAGMDPSEGKRHGADPCHPKSDQDSGLEDVLPAPPREQVHSAFGDVRSWVNRSKRLRPQSAPASKHALPLMDIQRVSKAAGTPGEAHPRPHLRADGIAHLKDIGPMLLGSTVEIHHKTGKGPKPERKTRPKSAPASGR
ncbi:uncharacterized protein BJ171DRAFT_568975 [Polychytrium aggregatum]|uniref:uncharacterized protein n=1 Tax=Polychytrium aggregatum TaxID=110093 RepID=UPI0022FF0F76|nr:uncharacterized protein BJ171DRAFT_568975 [Polychytrium aggregatum]KAI9203253.1 hypothetical protein BJ171DRAFT_568975 [Polychytrium aggregatum]